MGRSLTGKVASSKKLNRKIFLGTEPGDGVPVTYNWAAPLETTEVEIHVWGAGGRAVQTSPVNYSGGSGGGYASGVFNFNSSTDSLTIEVGTACTAGASGPAGISSSYVYVNQPRGTSTLIGGGAIPGVNPGTPGVVGEGSYILAPGISTARMFTANGGSGGEEDIAGGGAAGFIYGPGGAGGAANGTGDDAFASGGGIRGDGTGVTDATPPFGLSVDAGGFYPAGSGGGGFSGAAGGPPTQSWFYLEDIAGDGSAGGAGAGERYNTPGGPVRAGIFGGGGISNISGPGAEDAIGLGGYGGGGGGGDVFPTPTGVTSPGIVIIYY